MKKSVILVLCGFVVGLVSSVVVLFFMSKGNEGEELVLTYGDSFENVIINGSEKKEADFLSQGYSYTIVYYIDKSCGSCLDALYMIEQMYEIFRQSNVNNVILWQGEIGEKSLAKTSIPMDVNYYLEDTYINTSTPAFYILDERGTILFTGNQIKDVVDKLELIGILPAKENVISYYVNLAQKKHPEDRPIIIYFSMIGCKDCEAATPIIDSAFVQENYNVITFYRDGNKVSKEMINQVDYGGILARIYEIDWYPSFLLIDGENEVTQIGEMSVDELMEKLENQIGGNSNG